MGLNQKVAQFIFANWKKTIRYTPIDEDGRIGMPYPFTVPGMDGAFNELYYWDTFFTNRGLLLSERIDLAINNCEDIASLIERFGYMPNGSRTFYIGRSQPPYFALMARDVFEKTGDLAWFSCMLKTAEKEYDFWMTKRCAEGELNHYGSDYDDEYYSKFFSEIATRVGQQTGRDSVEAGRCYAAEAESGWDFNPRFEGRCPDYAPVDLTSLLYMYEKIFQQFSQELIDRDSAGWKQRAEKRKKLMESRMKDKNTGILYDYDQVKKRRSEVLSAASFWPYFVGISTEKEGLFVMLDALELPYGITATVQAPGNHQWGYGKAWAPIAMVAVEALDHAGMEKEAVRVAQKYVDLIARNYERTGGLWEKYDAITGEVVRGSEYETPRMLGWTAGVYLWAMKRIGENPT